MKQFLWDASSLVKRYVEETGSLSVHALFGISQALMLVTFLGYAETAAILRRKFNQGVVTQIQFTDARKLLRQEVLDGPDFALLTVDDAAFLGGVSLIDQYNLNSSDAALLDAYLRYAQTQSPSECVLVASARRLLRAAQAEGLPVLNPETVLAANLPSFLAAL